MTETAFGFSVSDEFELSDEDELSFNLSDEDESSSCSGE